MRRVAGRARVAIGAPYVSRLTVATRATVSSFTEIVRAFRGRGRDSRWSQPDR